jgi:hypothetical protein
MQERGRFSGMATKQGIIERIGHWTFQFVRLLLALLCVQVNPVLPKPQAIGVPQGPLIFGPVRTMGH